MSLGTPLHSLRWPPYATFAVAAAISILVMLIPPAPAEFAPFAAGLALTAAIGVAMLLLRRATLGSWPVAAPVLAFLLVIALVRHAEGGAESSFAPMFILPVIWLGIYGTRAQIAACVSAIAVLFLAPHVLFSDAQYPPAEWRQAVLRIVMSAIVGFTVHRLVAEVRAYAGHAAARARELADSERRYRTVVDSLTEVVFQTDNDGRWTFLNPAWREVTGYSVVEALGRPLVDFIHPHDRAYYDALMASVRTNAVDDFDCELRLARWDGGARWVHIQARLTTSEHGCPTGLSGTLADVTERREAELGLVISEQRARAAEEHFERAFASAPIGMGFLAADGCFAKVNKALCDMLDTDADALCASGALRRLIHPADLPAARAGMDLALAGGHPERVELRWMPGHGDVVTTLVSVVLIPADATEEAQLYVQVLDISERKRAERALQAANADLETRNREVEALASMQRDFVGASSHELRTPLTSILGYLDIVLDESELLHEEHLRHIEIAHRSGRRLLALVEDLVTVNRVDTDNLAIVRSPTGLAGLLQRIEEVFAPICAGREIRLAIEHVGPVAVDIDRIRTEQIFANLIGNAVKFTPPGGLIRVRVVVDDDHAAVDVIDSGVGISAEDLERVFDRFYRAPSAQRNAVPGTGLGLTIAQALAEAQGGWLAATSTPGLGSTFTAYLPLAKEQPWHASSSSTTTLTS